MRLLTYVFAITLLSPLIARADQELLNTRLLKPAFAFHTCVEIETRASLQTSSTKAFPNASKAEAWVWNRVLDKCFSVLTKDEVQGMIYQSYQGNQQRMIDFRDGLFWAERSHVISQVSDWFSAAK